MASLQLFGVSLDDIKDVLGHAPPSSSHDLQTEEAAGGFGSPTRQGTLKSLALESEKDQYFEGSSKVGEL